MRLFLSLLCVVAAIAQAAAQNPPAAAALDAEGIKAYQVKDYARFLEYERRALALEPGNARFLYNVACGEALLGHAAEAVAFLDQLLAEKLDLGAETDPDFTAIRNSPEWTGYRARLAELRRPMAPSGVAFTLPEPGLMATGIAADPDTGDVYIASLRQRKIVRRSAAGKITDLIGSAQDGFLAGGSLAIDARRRLLYATTSAVPFMRDYRKEDSGSTGVFAFDLNTGKVAKKAMLKPDGAFHLLNAMTVDSEGNLYVSDTGASGIYRLRPGASELEPFLPGSAFRATQGLALSEDEKTLFVADYTTGLWAVDLGSKQVRKLEAPAGVWLMGLDGISRAPGGLIAVQIGPKPERVLRIELDPEAARITKVEILEMGRPDYEGPVQGTVAGREFLYIANSQLDLGNGRTGEFASDRGRATIVLRLPLEGR